MTTTFYVSVPLLLDYGLFPVLTTASSVAVKILVHVSMLVAKISSRTGSVNLGLLPTFLFNGLF